MFPGPRLSTVVAGLALPWLLRKVHNSKSSNHSIIGIFVAAPLKSETSRMSNCLNAIILIMPK